jgi:hypothetical protein
MFVVLIDLLKEMQIYVDASRKHESENIGEKLGIRGVG